MSYICNVFTDREARSAFRIMNPTKTGIPTNLTDTSRGTGWYNAIPIPPDDDPEPITPFKTNPDSDLEPKQGK